MKTYKPLYGMTVLMIAITVLFSLSLLLAVSTLLNGNQPPQELVFYIEVAGIVFLILVIAVFLLNVIIHSSEESKTAIDGSYLRHEDKNLPLDNVLSLTLHLGRIATYGKYSGGEKHEPNQLVVWSGEEETHTVIERPSLTLLLHLRHLCPKAEFRVSGWGLYVVWAIAVFAALLFFAVFR